MRIIAAADRTGAVRDLLLVPAAAFASVALVEGRHGQAMRSVLRFAVDLVAIVIVAAVVLVLARSRSERGGRKLSAG